MTDRRVEIHAPFRRLHVVMYLVTAGLIAGPILLFGYAIADDAIAGRGVAAVLAITAAMCVAGGVVFWLAYLGSQRVAYVADDAIVFRTWIRLGRWGRERRISLADVKGVLLLRPHHIELALPDATTRVGTLYRQLNGVDRVGTFWWRRDDYLALEHVHYERGIPNQYRHVPGIRTLLSTY